MAVIEYSRNVLGYTDANSTEMNENTTHPVINLMEEQKNIENKGGTMRLGAWKCSIKENTLAQKIYGKTEIMERHRHRYEFNGAYLNELEKSRISSFGSKSRYEVGRNCRNSYTSFLYRRSIPS